MSDASTPSPKPAGSGYVRKAILLILLEIDSAIGLFILFRYRTDYPLLGVNILTISLLGLMAGLGTRIVLRRRGFFVRFVTGTAALFIGMFVMGWLTNWRFGFGPLIFFSNAIDWIGAAKLMIGMICFFVIMQAWWKRPAPASVALATPASVVVAPMPEPSSHPKIKPKRRAPRNLHFPIISARSKPAGAKKAAKAAKAPKSISSKKLSKPPTKPRPSLFHHRRPQVQLSKIERHLCPFCLEPVTRNDPRGVVECDICHTLHHGDCWAIAGVCQVPHYTA